MNWKDRSVLVTGADGFIGSHLVERLAREGARVRAFCLYNSNGSRGWLDESEEPTVRSGDIRMGDVRDARFIEESCKGIDTVFHLAALIAIPYSYAAPESYVDTNVRGTLNVLEAARRCGCRRVVHTSTSEVYGTPESLPILETHPLQGQSPYSASKIAADKLCEAYHCSFGLPVVVVRPFNTYGPRQSMRAVLPTLLVQLLSGRREVVLGRLCPRRDFTFVSDTVEGLLAAGEAEGVNGQVIQLGSGSAFSIEELFHTACRVLKRQSIVVQATERLRPDASEVMVLISDPAKAHRLLGWRAYVSLEEGILRTARWLEPRLDRYRFEDYHV